MFTSFRSVLVSTLLGAVAWGCGGRSVIKPQEPETENQGQQHLGKLAVNGNITQAVVLARVQQGPAPVSGGPFYSVRLTRNF